MYEEDWGDGGDDDTSRPYGGLPCPASQRTWRHPSELEPTLAMQRPTLPADQISRTTIVAITMVGVVAAAAFAVLLLPRGGAQVARVSSTTGSSLSLALGVSAGEAAWLGVVIGRGAAALEISAVAPGSPAAVAGLGVGDVLASIEGKPLTDPDDLADELARHRPGASIELAVVHDGHTAMVNVVLAAEPD